MQRLVLDRDLNELIEENTREAWEAMQKNEQEEIGKEKGKEPDQETERNRQE